MTGLIGNLKLRLLLRVTLSLLRRAQRNSARVRELMKAENFVFQIRTDGGAGGYFEVCNGGVSLHYGAHPRPDFAQSWRNGSDAFRVLSSHDETDLLRAYEDRLYRMQGRFTLTLWFNEVMKIARQEAK